MRRTASEIIHDLERRVARLEKQASSGRNDDKSVLMIAKTLNHILEKKGLLTDLVAERGQGVGILIDNSEGGAMRILKERTFGIKWLGDYTFMINGLSWVVSVNRDGDISVDADV